MPALSWENLDVFLQTDNTGGFAITAILELQHSADQRELVGIFDEPYLNAQLGEYEIDDAQPRFTCKENDVRDVKKGDALILEGRRFYIMSYPHQDGLGLCILQLEIEE